MGKGEKKKMADKKRDGPKVDPAALPYRPCVGVVLFNQAGLVWVGRRLDSPGDAEGGGAWWQMPQGGIDPGEAPREAAFRELHEETNVQSAEFIAETDDWFTYDLPAHLVGMAWGGKYRGQRQKWVALRFRGDEREIDVRNPGDGKTPPEFEEWRWEELERLPELIVPFKRKVYEDVVAAFRGLAKG